MFPKIETIADVLPHIAGKDAFVVAARDWGTVIDYRYVEPGTFDNPVAAECRGIKFGKDGRIIARPYHKFFNIGEKPETQHNILPWDDKHHVLEKLDGSLVHPVLIGDDLLWMTRMGITEVSQEASKRVTPQIEQFSKYFVGHGVTPMFEWVSPQNRIVVGYDRDELVLTAMREMVSGKYRTHTEMEVCVHGAGGGIPIVKVWSDQVGDVDAFLEHTRQLEDQEGYVVRWHNGHMVKMKADAYVLMHKTKDSLTWEKDVLALCLQNKVDDILPLLSGDDAAALVSYSNGLREQVSKLNEEVSQCVGKARVATNNDRKAFALEYAPKLPKVLQAVAFRVWSGCDVREELTKHLLKFTGSRTDVEQLRPVLGDVKWDRRIVMEAA